MQLVISPEMANKMTGIGVNRLRELARRGDFPAFRDGRKIFIYRGGFDEWLRKQAAEKIGFSAPLRRWRRGR